MLMFCNISNPLKLWEETWLCMCDDIKRQLRNSCANNLHDFDDGYVKQHVLFELETLLQSSSTPRSLSDFGLPKPNISLLTMLQNSLLLEEKCYDKDTLHQEHQSLYAGLNAEQLDVYNATINANNSKTQVLLFVYGHGGTGKTHLWKTIIAALRSKGQIVLAVAASGIASLLLPYGRTAHSRFKIPLELTNESVCHIKKKTNLSQLLLETSLIIWDEAPMSDRRCFESLDRTLRDITDKNFTAFGGKSIILGGDFRQTLPVQPKSKRREIISNCLPRSYLWKHLFVYKLTENMRLKSTASSSTTHEESQAFADWLLKIGNGDEGQLLDSRNPDVKRIEIPEKFLIDDTEYRSHDLIRFLYDENVLHHPTAETIAERAIICPKNCTVDLINDIVQQMSPGEYYTYFSTDSMVPHSKNSAETNAMFGSMELGNLIALRAKGRTPTLEVRVIRKWVPRHRNEETHFIFADKEASGMQAFVKGGDKETVNQKLQMHQCYKIEGYACLNPDEFTHTLTHPPVICLGGASKITPLPDIKEIPLQYFEIASRHKLLEQSKKEKGIINYIGIIMTRFEDKITRDSRPYVTFTTRDTSNENLDVTFWEEVAKSTHRFDKAQIEAQPDPKIIAITGAKIKDYTGTLQLQSTEATYVYLNPTTTQTEALKQMFSNPTIKPQPIGNTTQDITSIAALQNMQAHDLKGKSFIIKGTVVGVNTVRDWWYAACPKCGSTIYQTGAEWFCPKDGIFENVPKMYKIITSISDKTGNATATMFDRAATQMLGKTCHDLTTQQDPEKTIQQMISTHDHFHVTAKKDKNESPLRLAINKISNLSTTKTAQTSTSPIIKTPQQAPTESKIPAATSTKRQLLREKGEETSSTKKEKFAAHPHDILTK